MNAAASVFQRARVDETDLPVGYGLAEGTPAEPRKNSCRECGSEGTGRSDITLVSMP